VKELERELLRAHNRGTEDARVERSVRQIEEWSKITAHRRARGLE
jgi:hypothetical protein